MLEEQHIPAGRPGLLPGSPSLASAVVLWDRGSAINLVTHAWAAFADLPSKPHTVCISVVGQNSPCLHTREYTLELISNRGGRVTVHAVGMPSISSITGPGDISIVRRLFPEASPGVFQRPQGEVDLLVGMEHRGCMPDGGRFSEGLCLANTLFGAGHIITGVHRAIACIAGTLDPETRLGTVCAWEQGWEQEHESPLPRDSRHMRATDPPPTLPPTEEKVPGRPQQESDTPTMDLEQVSWHDVAMPGLTH